MSENSQTTTGAASGDVTTGDQRAALAELIARLEKADGFDRELDAHLFCAVRDGCRFVEFQRWNELSGRLYYRSAAMRGLLTESDNFPLYTASIDAALTLVPTNLHWSLNSRGVARVGGPAADFMIKGGEHAIPAISICIAALKARAEIETVSVA